MVEFVEMDEKVTFLAEMEEDAADAVILINKSNVDPDDVVSF
jgi:hypothetical protein